MLTFLLVSIPICMSAQGAITGDIERTISVWDTEEQAVGGAGVKIDFRHGHHEGLTDENGIFRLMISNDSTDLRARVTVRMYAYAPVDTLIDFASSANSRIVLRPIVLDEVKVTGYRKISKENAEKTTFLVNTAGLLKSAKADIALRRLPGITYKDDTYFLMGKQKKAKIFVNDLEVSEQELSKIEAKDIDHVDIYQIGLNDDHNSGEIRILLKKDLATLFKGEIDMGAQLANPGANGTPTFIFRSKTVDGLAWASYANDGQKSKSWINRDGREILSSDSHHHLQQYSASSRVNIFFSPQWMSSLSYSFFGYNSPADVAWQSEGAPQPGYKLTESYFSHFANLIVRHDLSGDRRFFAKARYFNYKSESSSSLPPTDFVGRMNELTGDFLYESDSLSLFGKRHRFATGLKSIYRFSSLTSSDKHYASDVQQFYVKDHCSLNDLWDVFCLLRGEWDGYTFEKGRNLRTFAFLPSITVNYSSKIGNISASYVRSIERPNVDYLSPDILYMNEFTQTKGNPGLASQTTDKLSLSYNRQIKDSYLTATASLGMTHRLIDRIYSHDYNTSTYENVGRGQTLLFDMAYNKPFFSNALNINLSTGIGYTAYSIAPNFTDHVLNEEHQGWHVSCSMNVTCLLPGDWFVNLSMNYQNKDIRFNETYYKKPVLNALLTKSLWNNNLDISLLYTDMFRLSGDQRVRHHLKGVSQTSTFRLPTSRLSLSFVYRFGKQFSSRNVGKTIVNEDITTK